MIDDMHARTPLNATAAMVIQKGIHWDSNKKIVQEESDMPIPTRPFPSESGAIDLTGNKFGRLTVIGLHAIKKGKWVCRCVCGRYVVRTRKAVLNPENFGDRCGLCLQLAYLKKKDYYNRTGLDLDLRNC